VFCTLDLKVKPYKACSSYSRVGCASMSSRAVLGDELRRVVESRMEINLRGIEETLNEIFQSQKLGLDDLRETIKSLEESFSLLSQKWSLQILYILFLRKTTGFGEMKKILGVNSRTLSDKLKGLYEYGHIERSVEQGPPLRVKYALTVKGRNTILLALPFLYYSSSTLG
jgi:DNA-binding HxlR family transcriptional regulator